MLRKIADRTVHRKVYRSALFISSTNSDLPEPLYPTIAIFMFGPIKFRFIKIQAGLFQNLIPLAIILIEEIYQG